MFCPLGLFTGDFFARVCQDILIPKFIRRCYFNLLNASLPLIHQDGIEIGGKKDPHYLLFQDLKAKVKEECAEGHSWQSRAKESLVSMEIL